MASSCEAFSGACYTTCWDTNRTGELIMVRIGPGVVGTLIAGALSAGCGGLTASALSPSEEPPAAPTDPTASPFVGSVTTEDDGTVTIEAGDWPMILDVGDDAIWATVFEPTKPESTETPRN